MKRSFKLLLLSICVIIIGTSFVGCNKNYSEEIKELINSVEATSKMKKCVEEIVKMNNRNKKVIRAIVD